MDYGPFGVRFLFFNTKKERRSIDELLIYFATPPFSFCCKGSITVAYYQPASVLTGIRFLPNLLKKWK